MSLGGGPGFLNILSGVAEGVGRVNARQREQQQDAIMNALRAQQIKESQSNIVLRQNQEERTVKNEETRQREQREAMELQARNNAAAAQTFRNNVNLYAEELGRVQPELDATTRMQIATMAVQKMPMPEPAEKPAPPDVKMLEYQDDQRHQAEVDKLKNTPEISNLLRAQPDRNSALSIAGNMGWDADASAEVWESGQAAENRATKSIKLDPIPQAEAEDMAQEAMAEIMASVSDMDENDPAYVDTIMKAARDKAAEGRAAMQAMQGGGAEFAPMATEVEAIIQRLIAAMISDQTDMKYGGGY